MNILFLIYVNSISNSRKLLICNILRNYRYDQTILYTNASRNGDNCLHELTLDYTLITKQHIKTNL